MVTDIENVECICELSQGNMFDFECKIAGNYVKIFPVNLRENLSIKHYLSKIT